ncbi:MAG: vWA domain-containing protein [Myxococcaceae bacterium]|nr:vWA domain-containing protein [Myxococcaceae bacterium]
MKRFSLLAACCAALMAVPSLATESKPAAADPKIQIAILIDTSSSMDGLINQTREQLWKIVNTFATARRDGKRAKLELALYQYGNDGLPAANHYVKKMSDLTSNLDAVSEQLFALRTNGGEEWCGAVIQHAMKELEWSGNPSDLKLIYIAGNEPFDQGPIAFREVVKQAIGRGIVVNTIHAGDERTGISQHWKDAATLADGSFLTIDQNRAVVRIDAPQDQELVKLNDQLNQTYIGYGPRGGEAKERQAMQDKNASGMSVGSMATRAAAKASAAYKNDDWDMVDAQAGGRKASDMPVAALPAPMQAMKPAERDAFVEQKAKERAEITAKIAKLSKDREAFVAAEMKKKAETGGKAMDEAVIESATKKAKAMAYEF